MDSDFENDSQDMMLAKHSPSKKIANRIWTIASGKGGVGKTFITSSLAICLSKLGYSVTVVDLDLSGANIHSAFGLSPSPTSIRQFFEGACSLQTLVIPTPIPRVSYIQGFWDAWAPTDVSTEQIRHLIPELRKLTSDFVLVDLGAGAIESHLELLGASDEKLIVTSPEPTSIEKTYRLIESYVCYSLKEHSIPEAYKKLIQTLQKNRSGLGDKHFSFRDYLKDDSGIQQDHFENLMAKPLKLIVNSCRSSSNMDLGYSIKSVCRKYYDFRVEYVGGINYDNAVWQSVRNREAVLIAQPFTPLAGQFLATCKLLIDPKELNAVIS